MRYFKYAAIVALVAVLVSGCPPWRAGDLTFTSADGSGWLRGIGGLFGMPAGLDTVSDLEGGDQAAQEREVIEPDVIRRDGNLLYVLNQYRGLTIVDLDTEELLAQVATYGYPRDLYLVGSRAYVLVGYANDYFTEGSVVGFNVSSRLYVLDVADPAEARILATFDLEGDFVDSRLVGDVLYAVSANYEYYWYEEGVAISSVAKEQTSESWVTSVDVSNPADIHIVDELGFDGYGNVIQATPFAIFVASSDWSGDTTTITYIDISDPNGAIRQRGNILLDGYVADRFKMDAYEGVLRVVSSTDWRERHVYVTTVDLSDPDNLAVLGRADLEDALGETLFATRFDGPRGYIVTFFIVDPLFVLDLSDPANPTVAGALEVPGWSTHIEPQGDRLVALGVDDTNGRQVCVSLFDVTDPAAPALLDRESFGGQWTWSSAYDDVKAFTVLEDMLIVPFTGWNEGGGFDRLQFVSYTADTLELHGYVDLSGGILRSFDYNGLYYGVTTEQLATIDASDPDAPTVTNRLTLAEYVGDYHELGADLGVEVISRYDDGTVLVRTVAADGAPLGEVVVEIANLVENYAYNDTVLLITSEWEGDYYYFREATPYYRVVQVDCSTPESPVVTANIRVDVEPYWGGGWYYDYMPIRESVPGALLGDAVSGAKQAYDLWWPYYPTGDSTFLVGGKLALRCSADEYDVTFGEATASQGLAVVDLATAAWTQTIGLGYEWVEAINAANGKLYVTTKEDLGSDLIGRYYCAYYLSELDVAGPAMGPLANVPGTFVQYDAAEDILITQDMQYSGEWWTVESSLESLKWDGGEHVEPIDSLDMPDNAGTVEAAGARLYYETYNEGSVVGSVNVAPDGALSFGERIKVTEDWASILGTRGNDVYLVIGGGAIARYSFAGEPELLQLLQVMGRPARIRFGETNAYAPLGYAGLAVLPY